MTRCTFLLLVLLSTATTLDAAAPLAAPLAFEQHVRPILKAHCLECHGEARRPKGGLDLRLVRLMHKGGDNGAAIAAGDAEGSLLYQHVREGRMPPGKVKLSATEADVLRRWIDQGARIARAEPASLAPGLHISDDDRNFWSFRPVIRHAIPQVTRTDLVRTPIDAFLLRSLEAKSLSFAAPADRMTLIRRLSFDLTGLPPTPGEVDAFLADARPDAYERLVDRLLSSPAYGERWGRHWLDVAGYADSHGAVSDPVRPHAWKYRDYVIRSFNADKPFDRFVTEQLAGDELARPTMADLSPTQQELLIATGFLRTAPDATAGPGADLKQAANQAIADTLQIVSTSLLGLTMHCAQCHNHRYDPIPQTDYYRLRAIFEPAYNVSAWRVPRARWVSLLRAADRERGAAIEREAAKIDAERLTRQGEFIERTFQKQLQKLPEAERPEVEKAFRTPVAKRTRDQQKLMLLHPSVNVSPGSLYLYDQKAADELTAIAARASNLRATKPTEDFIDALTEVPGKTLPTTRLFQRGDPEQPGEAVSPGGLVILEDLALPTIPVQEKNQPTTGRRLALARQLTSGQHPLTARVIVNRLWLHHFGRGIVNTPGDFGALGERPTHPELLDWLASELVESGWSLKHIHRLILTSAAYRQSGRSVAGRTIDPENRLLWRMPVRRLEAEAVRDAVLAVTGQLVHQAGGPPVPVMPDASGQIVLGVDLRDGAGYLRGKAVDLGRDLVRRSVYVQARRSMPLTVLETFDVAAPSPTCEKRSFSTAPQQALLMLNSEFILTSATAFATLVEREVGMDPEQQVRAAWRRAFGRQADAEDVREGVAFLRTQTETFRRRGTTGAERQALATLCQTLLSGNAFLYVD